MKKSPKKFTFEFRENTPLDVFAKIAELLETKPRPQEIPPGAVWCHMPFCGSAVKRQFQTLVPPGAVWCHFVAWQGQKCHSAAWPYLWLGQYGGATIYGYHRIWLPSNGYQWAWLPLTLWIHRQNLWSGHTFTRLPRVWPVQRPAGSTQKHPYGIKMSRA